MLSVLLLSFSLTLGNLKSVIDCYYSGSWVFFPMGVGGSWCQLWGYSSTQQLPLRHTLSLDILSMCSSLNRMGTGRIKLRWKIPFCQVQNRENWAMTGNSILPSFKPSEIQTFGLLNRLQHHISSDYLFTFDPIEFRISENKMYLSFKDFRKLLETLNTDYIKIK